MYFRVWSNNSFISWTYIIFIQANKTNINARQSILSTITKMAHKMWHSLYSTAYDRFCLLFSVQYSFEFQLKTIINCYYYTNQDFVQYNNNNFIIILVSSYLYKRYCLSLHCKMLGLSYSVSIITSSVLKHIAVKGFFQSEKIFSL